MIRGYITTVCAVAFWSTFLIAALAAGYLAPVSFAQAVAPGDQHSAVSPLTFDVASVRPNTTADRHTHSSIYNSWSNSKFTATNVPLRMLLNFSFDMPESRIIGGPDWLDSTTFDIEAKSDRSLDDHLSALSPEDAKLQKQRMLQALLADRFKLIVHQETREFPIYALVVAKGGPILKPNLSGNHVGTGRNAITVNGGNDTVAILADKLAQELGRPVDNRTTITGRYDITLKWTPDDAPTASTNGAANPDAPPDIFTAIQEQLGLKLERAKGPVPVLVIDHVEKPSEN
jgi:uncharacterized protein (TIGR03435 family)